MPFVSVIYIITTRQFVRPGRGIDRLGCTLIYRNLKHPLEII